MAFFMAQAWHGSPRLEDPVDDGAESNECTINTKEDREHIFMIGGQVGVVKTIYYPRRGIHL